MRLGSLEVTPISDGFFKMPREFLARDPSDWDRHEDLLGPDGMLEVPIGCFLVRTGEMTVLVDAGLGPVSTDQFGGGKLPAGLEAAGCRPEDIDLLLFSHLHFDHIGWAVQEGKAFFPNATVRFGAQDVAHFLESEKPDTFSAPLIGQLLEEGRVELIDDDGEVAPGISTIHAPGHTPGHRCIVLSSGDERALLLGDAITCPIQLEETDWGAMSDVDPEIAARTREALWKELESTGAATMGAHFPGLQWGRVLVGEGKRYFS